ncbi:hypothetical protein C2845_PM01G42550 [Panicum miliaceum]|uniref:Uncharacterized protein n=1 Tax=Panicum miliaceum TaxID=4540 RepID=A0A3L6TMN8_PANMI|nr:hypothetical protein C2845_PM01G42550 [Panicum miliaceum]
MPANVDDDRSIVAATPSSTRSYPDDSQWSKPEAKQQEGPGRRKVGTTSVALGLGGRQSKRNKSNNAEPIEVTEDVELQVDEDAEPTEVDAVLAFKASAVADGQSRLPSAEVVSKALSQASSNSTFLKNASIAAPSSRSRHRQGSSVLHERVEELQRNNDDLLRKSDALHRETEVAHEAWERIQRQYEELKKQQEDSHRILSQFIQAQSNLGTCDTLVQGLIGLIGYTYQQVATSFPEAQF